MWRRARRAGAGGFAGAPCGGLHAAGWFSRAGAVLAVLSVMASLPVGEAGVGGDVDVDATARGCVGAGRTPMPAMSRPSGQAPPLSTSLPPMCQPLPRSRPRLDDEDDGPAGQALMARRLDASAELRLEDVIDGASITADVVGSRTMALDQIYMVSCAVGGNLHQRYRQ